MADPAPQPGILPEPDDHAHFLVLRVREPGKSARDAVKTAAQLPALLKSVAKLDAKARVAGVVGFGPALWDHVSPGARPRTLRPFRTIGRGQRRAPATGGDLLLHVHSKRSDLCFELTSRFAKALGDTVDVAEEVQAFRYLDTRDLTGFIDGTENPKGASDRSAAALIGAEDPAFAGGSYVFTQRYVHDLARFGALPVAEQERVIGRRKRDSRELSKKAKPETAHISRTVIVEDGEELEIVRHSVPYGGVREAGLFFIAYTRDLAIPQKMLARMLGTSGDGVHDHLMDYTRAVSGAHFFAPSLRTLRELAR